MAKKPRPKWLNINGRIGYGIEARMEDMHEWTPTIEGIREAILTHKVIGSQLADLLDCDPIAHELQPTADEVNQVNILAHKAVSEGCMIDFGMLPNEVMINCANRAGPMWNKGAFRQPFGNWIFIHSWEDGRCVYLITEMDSDCFEICELVPVWIEGYGGMLSIGDRGNFTRMPDIATKYQCKVAPAAPRFALDPELRKQANNGGDPQNAAAGNIGDPIMTALLILSTKNVDRITIPAPHRLNKHRIRKGKHPIPPYDIINAKPYVTAIRYAMSNQPKAESQGGTHASPIPHIRMGHDRHYKTGSVVHIEETLVNVPEEQRRQFKFTRSHYVMR